MTEPWNPRLALPLERMRERYDVVVVGSGYGGSIAASRMARAVGPAGGRLSVCLLERGREIRPGDYPDNPFEAVADVQLDTAAGRIGSATALFDIHLHDDMHVLVGCGLGGTSLINANAAVVPDKRVFADPAWPAQIRAEAAHMNATGNAVPGGGFTLADGYRRAREMLRPVPYPDSYPTPVKLKVFESMAESLGAKCLRPPINIHFGAPGPNHVGVTQSPCDGCGDCMTGCNRSAKNTVLMNYLPDAVNHGAEIFTEVRVSHVSRDGGDWRVHFHPSDDTEGGSVAAGMVVLGAGTLGSTEILLRSAARGLPVSDRLGKGFSGNGDVLAFGYNMDRRANGIGTGRESPDPKDPVGPCLAGMIDLRGTAVLDDGMILEEGTLPGAMAAVAPAVLASAAALVGTERQYGWWRRFRRWMRRVDSAFRGAHHGATANTQTLLGMSHDKSTGEMRLDDDRINVVWPDVGEKSVFDHVNDAMRKATESQGGTFVINPIWAEALGEKVVTVHPLGGCAMADDATHGVVDHMGRVFSGKTGTEVHPGLHVMDGAVMPRSLGINPLLTISALAERCCAGVAGQRGMAIDYGFDSAADR